MSSRSETPSYLAEPTIQYLLQVLDQLHDGELELPRFQRFDVWKPSQRIELLRSIREGIPIGTLMIWRTRRKVNSERHLGTHDLPEPRVKGTTRQYVLDGVQRLSTLYQALFPATRDTAAEHGETADDFTMYFDLREGDFCSKGDLDDGAPLPHHLPLTTLRDSVNLLKFQRGLSGADADKLTERADALYNAFRTYKVPVVPLASDDLAFATKSFQRINTQGTPMSEVHMVNALVYSKDFDLLERIREARQERLAPMGWGELENEDALRTIKALLGIDVYSTRPDETREALLKRESVVDDAIEALARVAQFVAEEMGMLRPSLVPYVPQIVLLARTLHDHPNPTERGREALRDWIALTTYTELFAGNMSASRFESLARELGEAAQGKPLAWRVRRPLTRRDLPHFDFRHARARFLALRMARARAGDSGSTEMLAALATGGVDAVPQLITHRMAKTGGAWMRSAGARVVTTPGELTEVRRTLLSRDADPQTLASHLVSPEVHELLVAERFEDAVRRRADDLNRQEQHEFQELLQRHERLRHGVGPSVVLTGQAIPAVKAAVHERGRLRSRPVRLMVKKRRRS